MAELHAATLTPSKLELLAAWLPTQSWADVSSPEALSVAGAYRFDDPAGQVGVECHLLDTGDGRWLHVPTTYRGAPLEGAEQWLMGTMDHSVLGQRWVYFGVGDPVAVQVLAEAINANASEAVLWLHSEAGVQERPRTTHARGNCGLALVLRHGPFSTDVGTYSQVMSEDWLLEVRHVLPQFQEDRDRGSRLLSTWPGQTQERTLATLMSLGAPRPTE
jgi:hypothetical protein